MQENPLTLTHQQPSRYLLHATYSPSLNHLSIQLQVNTSTFPKFYSRAITTAALEPEQKFIFQSVGFIYNMLEEMENVHVDTQSGAIVFSVQFELNKKVQTRQLFLSLHRSMERELQQIRSRIESSLQSKQSLQDLGNRIERLWRREEENEKIFMKFKEEAEFRIQELLERLNIQNTHMGIIRQDVNHISDHMGKLTRITAPMLARISITQESLDKLILQDRKIMHVGEQPCCVQIVFKDTISAHKKYQFGCKIVNSKKNNIVVGLTNLPELNGKGGLKRQKAILSLSANGILNDSAGTAISDSSSDKESSKNLEPMKPMQAIHLIVDFQKDKATWKCAGKKLAEARLRDMRPEEISVFIELSDPGDAVEVF